MKITIGTLTANRRIARQLWGRLPRVLSSALSLLTTEYHFSVASGDLLLIDGRWYVSHAGLLRLARRRRCAGIQVRPLPLFCDARIQRWTFEATVYRSKICRGFVGFGDAEPANVSPLVHGAEMRVAETRAVNRALRKAYGIGLCSVEEIGSLERQPGVGTNSRKLPQALRDGNGHCGWTLRDRLYQLIRQHKLDPNLVKAYAAEFCGKETLREATREQVETFVQHLAHCAQKDLNALLCQLNSYLPKKEGVA